jgi:ABC-2 type transport system ATP-binding protein
MAQTGTTYAIEVRDLVKRYPKATTNAVDGIDFAVERGEIFGLLGPNGAGKTTTIGVLTGGTIPTHGHGLVMGIDVVADPMAIKQRIAVVPQRSNLDQSLRAKEILTFHAAYHGVPRAERNARATALMTELGLAQVMNAKISRYSGGMTQRMMIARALMHSPDVLFLDEPTNNLDPQTRLFLWERIQSLNEQGLSILLTTHDMLEADQLCRRIAIMDYGKILALDTPAELKKLIPGGTTLDLQVRVPDLVRIGGAQAGQEERDRALAALRTLPGADKVEAIPTPEGQEAEQGVQTFRLFSPDAGSLVIGATQAVASAGCEVRDLHLVKPSLEDVFIFLTGRQLR